MAVVEEFQLKSGVRVTIMDDAYAGASEELIRARIAAAQNAAWNCHKKTEERKEK